jgi:hypothetical protein
MNNINEIYQDIITNCDILLQLLTPYTATNETPEGRMIFQCRWLKEQAQAANITFPAEFVLTLRHVSSEGYLHKLASNESCYNKEIGIYLYRLIKLSQGELLSKESYYPHIIRHINEVIKVIESAHRPIIRSEAGMITEMVMIKNQLLENKIAPPLMTAKNYPNFNEVYMIFESSIDDLPDGQYLCETIANFIIEGVRPNSWVTPDEAEAYCKARGY